MAVSSTLARQISRLSRREKAALADHLWREAENQVEPVATQLATLERRAEQAVRQPQSTRPAGDAVRRLRR